jgi:hypothetical protein
MPCSIADEGYEVILAILMVVLRIFRESSEKGTQIVRWQIPQWARDRNLNQAETHFRLAAELHSQGERNRRTVSFKLCTTNEYPMNGDKSTRKKVRSLVCMTTWLEGFTTAGLTSL